jgi:hypothetical protein
MSLGLKVVVVRELSAALGWASWQELTLTSESFTGGSVATRCSMNDEPEVRDAVPSNGHRDDSATMRRYV